jgi:hypothetical protein
MCLKDEEGLCPLTFTKIVIIQTSEEKKTTEDMSTWSEARDITRMRGTSTNK